MDFLLFLITFVLFFLLTPGVLVNLPPKAGKLVTSLVHALLFAILWSFFNWLLTPSSEPAPKKKIEIVVKEKHDDYAADDKKDSKKEPKEEVKHELVLEHVGSNIKNNTSTFSLEK
jgi:uncharacterized membrane protein